MLPPLTDILFSLTLIYTILSSYYFTVLPSPFPTPAVHHPHWLPVHM